MINRIGGSSWFSGNWSSLLLARVILENHLPAFCLLILGLSSSKLLPISWVLNHGEREGSFGSFGQGIWNMGPLPLTCANNLYFYMLQFSS